ncbi:MAG: hypothetical protein H0A76_02170 [Candidatus Thiodubiliella endoseptemdiera]|uniref:Uncharacterized protein n=1 Tax=Candidatus Thiodubiliella endoseptemdiera TaxID=2738886 RepID=A0A853F4U5_9GAMM|nr:hypothetical protein [Candidatus Thiodubiliella endoseptemdiera]
MGEFRILNHQKKALNPRFEEKNGMTIFLMALMGVFPHQPWPILRDGD